MHERCFLKLVHNGWCYEQVCLAEMFKLPKMLLANLLIARVMLSLRFINEELKSKHRSSIYFFMCGGKN